MKKRTIILIVIACVALLLIMLGTTMLAMNAKKTEEAEKRVTPEYLEEQTITCTREKYHDDVDEVVTLYMQKGVLITKSEADSWYKAEAKEKTCEYYTSKNKGLNTKKGVSSSVTCDERRGNFNATYTIKEMDKEDMRLKEFDYIDEREIFNYKLWIQFMQNNGYKCN